MTSERSLLRAVGKLLGAGLGFQATVAAIAEQLQRGLGAGRVAIWARPPAAVRFQVIAAPPGAEPAPVEALDRVPAAAPGTVRVPLLHDGAPVGLLEAELEAGGDGHALLELLAGYLAPWFALVELSADLAHEVASQAREIDEQRRFISFVIDSLPVGLYVIDREYRVQVWNRRREAGTQGIRRDDVIGRSIFDVLTRQDPAALRDEFERVFTTGAIVQEELEVAVGGETRWYRSTRIPMRLEDDAITHVITVGEDVTEAKRSQAQMLQGEKLAAIGQLAAGVMHEINNPLATIGACVAAMEGRLGEMPPPAESSLQEYLKIIDKEVDRCTQIVSGLLDFSRPKSKAKQATELNAVVEDALFLLKHHKRFAQLIVTRELDPRLPPVLGNAAQLVQVLMALMLNAVDAMEAGGRLTLRTGRSRVRPDEVYVEVEDTGVGISRAEQGKIFEPFYTTKPPGQGTGLGLSICYGIVQEHRGRIEVESQPGQGATFRVVLPTADGTKP
ncbi:MAG TPA: ATP-binding protein [Gemmatimonadales bacterium]|nr:ATP-binding protein [Gemmatimonadales bacterium]